MIFMQRISTRMLCYSVKVCLDNCVPVCACVYVCVFFVGSLLNLYNVNNLHSNALHEICGAFTVSI